MNFHGASEYDGRTSLEYRCGYCGWRAVSESKRGQAVTDEQRRMLHGLFSRHMAAEHLTEGPFNEGAPWQSPPKPPPGTS